MLRSTPLLLLLLASCDRTTGRGPVDEDLGTTEAAAYDGPDGGTALDGTALDHERTDGFALTTFSLQGDPDEEPILWGLVTNVGTITRCYLKLQAQAFDADDLLVAEDWAYVDGSVGSTGTHQTGTCLWPGEVGIVHVGFSDPTGAEVQRIGFWFEYLDTQVYSPDTTLGLVGDSPTVEVVDDHEIVVAGELINTGDEAAAMAIIPIQLWVIGDDGIWLDDGLDHAIEQGELLQPGESISFETYDMYVPVDVGYTLDWRVDWDDPDFED